MTEYIQSQAQVVNGFFEGITSIQIPPDVCVIFPRFTNQLPGHGYEWWAGILGYNLLIMKFTFLQKLEHCKALRDPAHEFLIAYFTIEFDGRSFQTSLIIDRCPRQSDPYANIRIDTWCSIRSFRRFCPHTTPTPTSSSDNIQGTSGESAERVKSMDRVMIPPYGLWRGLKPLAERAFGTYKVLSTLNETRSMNLAQFAALIDVIDDFAPWYTETVHQCSWFALLVFSLVKDEAGGEETPGDVDERGTRLGMILLGNSHDDEETVKVRYHQACILLILEIASVHAIQAITQLGRPILKTGSRRSHASDSMSKVDEATRLREQHGRRYLLDALRYLYALGSPQS